MAHLPAGGNAQCSEALVFFVDLDASLHQSDLSLPEPHTAYNTRLNVVRNALKCFLQNHSLAVGGGKVQPSHSRLATSRLNGQYYSFFGVLDGPCELMPLSPLFDTASGANNCMTALDQYLPHRTSFKANLADKPISLGTIAQCLSEVQRQQIAELDQNPLPGSPAARKSVAERVITRGILIGSRCVDGSAPSPLIRDPSVGGAAPGAKRTGKPPIYLDTVLLGVDQAHWSTGQVALDLHGLCEAEKLTSFSVTPCATGLSVGTALNSIMNTLHHSTAWTHGLRTGRKGKHYEAPIPPVIPGLQDCSKYQVVVPQPKKIRLTAAPPPPAPAQPTPVPSPAKPAPAVPAQQSEHDRPRYQQAPGEYEKQQQQAAAGHPPANQLHAAGGWQQVAAGGSSTAGNDYPATPERTTSSSGAYPPPPPDSRPPPITQGEHQQHPQAPKSRPETPPVAVGHEKNITMPEKKVSMDALFGAPQDQAPPQAQPVAAPSNEAAKPTLRMSDADLAAAVIQSRAEAVLSGDSVGTSAQFPASSGDAVPSTESHSTIDTASPTTGGYSSPVESGGPTTADTYTADASPTSAQSPQQPNEVVHENSIDRLKAQLASAVVDDSSVKSKDPKERGGDAHTPIPLAGPLSPHHPEAGPSTDVETGAIVEQGRQISSSVVQVGEVQQGVIVEEVGQTSPPHNKLPSGGDREGMESPLQGVRREAEFDQVHFDPQGGAIAANVAPQQQQGEEEQQGEAPLKQQNTTDEIPEDAEVQPSQEEDVRPSQEPATDLYDDYTMDSGYGKK